MSKLKLPDGYCFHHIGYATQSIENEKYLFRFLGYYPESEDFIDPVQGVKGCFLIGSGPRIELLENLPGRSVLNPWISSGTKMYHLAYVVNCIQSSIDWACSYRAKVIVKPVSSIAFRGSLITFLMFRNGLVLELIENSGTL